MSRMIPALTAMVFTIVTAAPASALYVLALRTDGNIAVVKHDAPNVLVDVITLPASGEPGGLVEGEKLVAIAFDRRTGILFGFGLNKNNVDQNDDSGRFYVINYAFGEAFSLQGDGMDQSPHFEGLRDDYQDDPCGCGAIAGDASYGMRVTPDGQTLEVINTSGDIRTLALSDGSTSSSSSGVSNEMPVASADFIDSKTGDVRSLYLIVDTTENALELQFNPDSGHIVDLFNPFDGESAETVHVGFDVWETTGFVSCTVDGVTRLHIMDLKAWWDDGAGDDDSGQAVPQLSPVGIIGDGSIPITSLAVLPGSGLVAVGRGAASGPGVVSVIHPFMQVEFARFTAFGTGGARVALGDIDGDGFPDIVTVPGPGPVASVKVFSGDQMINEGVIVQIPNGFQPKPFGESYTGGLFVASANIDPEYGPIDDIVIGTASGKAKFRIIDGEVLVMSPAVSVPGASFESGGARVAVGYFEEADEVKAQDGPAAPKSQRKPYVVVGSGAPAPAKSRISLYDAEQVLASAFDEQQPDYDVARINFVVPGFTGPVFVAAADLFNSGDQFIVGRGTGSPTVKVIDPLDIDIEIGPFPNKGTVNNVVQQFQAFGGTVGGARVGAALLNPFSDNSWHTVILAGTGSGRSNRIAAFPDSDGDFDEELFWGWFFNPDYEGGVFIAGGQGLRTFHIPIP